MAYWAEAGKPPWVGLLLHPAMGISSRSPNTALYKPPSCALYYLGHFVLPPMYELEDTQTTTGQIQHCRLEPGMELSLDLVPDMSVWPVCHPLSLHVSSRNQPKSTQI